MNAEVDSIKMTQISVFFVICLLAPQLQAQGITGNVKATAHYARPPVQASHDGKVMALSTRLNAKRDMAAAWQGEFAYELGFMFQNLPDPKRKTYYRAYDLNETPYEGHAEADANGHANGEMNLQIKQNLDRLLLSWRQGAFDLKLGRQAIGFGSGRLVNPTDVLMPFGFAAIDTEHRAGVDGLMVRYTLDLFSEVDFGYILGDRGKSEESAAYFKFRTLIGETDLVLLAMRFFEHQLWGWDVQSSLGPFGLWTEGARVRPSEDDDSAYTQYLVGMDYKLTGTDLYAFVEYHHSSAGFSNPDDYIQASSKLAFQEGRTQLLGQNYILLGFQYPVNPLVQWNSSFITHVSSDQDDSSLWMTQFVFDAGQDLVVLAGIMWGDGSSGAGKTSEFGSFGDYSYLSVRRYF